MCHMCDYRRLTGNDMAIRPLEKQWRDFRVQIQKSSAQLPQVPLGRLEMADCSQYHFELLGEV